MRRGFLIGLIGVGFILAQQVAIGAQEDKSDGVAGAETSAPITKNTGAAGDALSLGLTGGRRPLYRLQKSDVIQVSFPFSPELDESVTVQPERLHRNQSTGKRFCGGEHAERG